MGRVLVFFGALLVACGGADPSPLLDSEAGVPMMDANVPDQSMRDSQPGSCPSVGTCGDPNVPSGWSPVAVVLGDKAECPGWFGTAQDAVADPMLGSGACSCGCMKTADPSCEDGSSTWSGIGMTCSSGAAPLTYSGGACRPTGGTVDDYDEATTIAPSGGSCAVQTLSNNAAVTTTAAHMCVPNQACAPATCGGFAPPGMNACIMTMGDVTCPTGSAFSTKHAAATSVTVQCSDCGTGCTFDGTCDKPTLSFYSDSSCLNLVVSIPADGTCDPTGHNGATVGGTKYTATPSFTGCTATGSSNGSITPQGGFTLCCSS